MTAVYGLYADPDAAQQAVNGLRSLGVERRDILVISSEPFEEHAFSHADAPTWMHWIAGAGGVVGLVAGYLLTTTTQQSWPIQTSGMPIVSTWPNTIVVFEMTMLGAILATVVTLFVSAKLPARGAHLYDPEVSNGYILVGVENPPPDLAANLEAALAVGEGRVRVVG